MISTPSFFRTPTHELLFTHVHMASRTHQIFQNPPACTHLCTNHFVLTIFLRIRRLVRISFLFPCICHLVLMTSSENPSACTQQFSENPSACTQQFSENPSACTHQQFVRICFSENPSASTHQFSENPSACTHEFSLYIHQLVHMRSPSAP